MREANIDLNGSNSNSNQLADVLSQYRQRLLDLGLRNPLISYRYLKAKSVSFVPVPGTEVVRALLENGRALPILPKPEDHALTEDLLSPAKVIDQMDSELLEALQSDLPRIRLANNLKQMARDARTAMEEQGVNLLFLAVGMLHWYESDSSEEPRRAPLMLIPVSIDRQAGERYILRHNGDEVEENRSLLAKLESEQNIRLASEEHEDDRDFAATCRTLAQAVEHLERWQVVPDEVALGFFSFTKYTMYKDLAPESWPGGRGPVDHPVLGALLGDGLREPPPVVLEEDFLDDRHDVGEVLTVMDCDSSQLAAILDVRAGRNLVIEGPPGTGKSQTITNLIADAVGQGKTVLFVSEKRAALEVVKRRLDSVGLGDACLELHSHKANKRSVLAELQRTLKQGRPVLGDREGHVGRLSRARQHLNRYCDAINTPFAASGVTPQQALGQLLLIRSRIGDYALPRYDTTVTDDWTRAEREAAEHALHDLAQRLDRMGPVSQHPFRKSRRQQLLPSENEALQSHLRRSIAAVRALEVEGQKVAMTLGLEPPVKTEDYRNLLAAASRAATAPDLSGLDLEHVAWQEPESLKVWLEDARRLAELHSRFDATLLPEAWEQDILEARGALAAHGHKWWRFLLGDYRKARTRIAGLCSTVPDSPAGLLELADAILGARRIREAINPRREEVARCLGHRLSEHPAWDELLETVAWLGNFQRDIVRGFVPSTILEFLAQHRRSARPLDPEILERLLDSHGATLSALVGFLDLDEVARWGGPFKELPLTYQLSELDQMLDRIEDLQTLLNYLTACERVRILGLGSLINQLDTWDAAASELLDTFRYGYYQRLLDRAFAERNDLQEFDGGLHEQVRSTFRELDHKLQYMNQVLLAARHHQGLPSLHQPEGQVQLLKKEFEKRRAHLPLRRLMTRAGQVVQRAIKPVFMMSPLSVATFIPPGSLEFDLVIFDEASQVQPVDAFGAIIRGRQIVVVGDSRQLPPTDFFARTITASEDAGSEEEEAETIETESILGLLKAQGAPDRMLRWHYRSRHESLITVSNHLFYGHELVVFASPVADRGALGLVYRYLPETIYERSGSRTNPAEARAVARAAMEHARTAPDHSLGIAAFSVVQRDAILDEIERLQRDEPAWEEFMQAHPHEPFFVKNLENVQGDERDVILVSIGYGKDAGGGPPSMNFGPVNKDSGAALSEGERRLNVLFTRARIRCEIFTNLQPEDLDLNRTRARGVRALRTFLSYARNGSLDVPTPTGRDADSPFEEAVGLALMARGHRVVRQVGSGGFRIDLAITDPDQPGRYLLGIECDGATYHSSRSARDRDRLRQQVLEGLGWRIHRVWSTDWFRNPARQIQRIEDALSRIAEELPSLQVHQTAIEREEHQSDAPPAGSSFPPYILASPLVELRGREFHRIPLPEICSWICQVVAVEAPVHYEDVKARIVAAAGIKRMGGRISQALETALQLAVQQGQVRKGDFFWNDSSPPPVRDRSKLPANMRTLDRICDEEIATAVLLKMQNAYAMEFAQLATTTCRALGFSRTTEEMCGRVQKIVDGMVARGELLIQNGIYSIA